MSRENRPEDVEHIFKRVTKVETEKESSAVFLGEYLDFFFPNLPDAPCPFKVGDKVLIDFEYIDPATCEYMVAHFRAGVCIGTYTIHRSAMFA